MGSFNAISGYRLSRECVDDAPADALPTHPYESVCSVLLSLPLSLLFLRECRDHALTLFLDVLGEAGMALLDEPGRQPELQERHRESRSEIVQVGAHLGELERFDCFVEKLLHRLVQLVVGEKPGFGRNVSHTRILA